MADSKLNQELKSLIALTKSGKIAWGMQPNNPNFYKWDKLLSAGKSYQVSIQAQNPGHPQAAFYFFSIIQTQPPPQQVVLQINSQMEPLNKVILEELFMEAQNSVRNNTSNILTDLMKDL